MTRIGAMSSRTTNGAPAGAGTLAEAGETPVKRGLCGDVGRMGLRYYMQNPLMTAHMSTGQLKTLLREAVYMIRKLESKVQQLEGKEASHES